MGNVRKAGDRVGVHRLDQKRGGGRSKTEKSTYPVEEFLMISYHPCRKMIHLPIINPVRRALRKKAVQHIVTITHSSGRGCACISKTALSERGEDVCTVCDSRVRHSPRASTRPARGCAGSATLAGREGERTSRSYNGQASQLEGQESRADESVCRVRPGGVGGRMHVCTSLLLFLKLKGKL